MFTWYNCLPCHIPLIITQKKDSHSLTYVLGMLQEATNNQQKDKFAYVPIERQHTHFLDDNLNVVQNSREILLHQTVLATLLHCTYTLHWSY